MSTAADQLAAKAWSVVSRWQSPNWTLAAGQAHTGDLIQELADAAREYEAEKAQPVQQAVALTDEQITTLFHQTAGYGQESIFKFARAVIAASRASAEKGGAL